MVHEVLPPRVEDGDKADPDAETLTCEFRERLGGRFEQDGVHGLSVSQGKGIELIRQREDDMEVLGWGGALSPWPRPTSLSSGTDTSDSACSCTSCTIP